MWLLQVWSALYWGTGCTGLYYFLSISMKSLLQRHVFHYSAPAFKQKLNCFPHQMHRAPSTVYLESLPVPSKSLPKASLFFSLRCAKHLAVIWWNRSHLAASSVDTLCTSLYPAVSQYHHGTVPGTTLNSSFHLSRSLANKAREVEAGSLSVIQGNLVFTTVIDHWATVVLPLKKVWAWVWGSCCSDLSRPPHKGLLVVNFP